MGKKTKRQKATPAVAYIRMSSAQQAASPDQQRAEVAKLAKKHGYEIVQEYFDAAISGDEIDKRPAFRQMLDDAADGKFKAILCWDQDRFGRMDMWRSAVVIQPLREAGVSLLTVTQGVIDWDDIAGQLVYMVNQQQKHGFLRDLSRNVLRGQLARIDSGSFVRSAPIGMCRVFYDESGQEQKRVEWDEQFTKPKTWTVSLAVSSRVHEVEAMRWAFDTYAYTDCGLRQICFGLAERGVRTAAGEPKCWNVVRDMLTNPKYVGRLEAGRYCHAKFFTVDGDGEICPRSTVAASGSRQQREPFLIVDGAFEALIDRETFDRVQQKIVKRRVQKDSTQTTSALLVGLLKCNLCGCGFGGNSKPRRGEGKMYRCYGHVKGRCSSPSVPQDAIERFVITEVDKLIGDDAVNRLRAHIAEELKGDGGERQLMALRTRLNELDREIANGRRNVLRLEDPDDVREVNEMLAERRRERDDVQARLAAVEGSNGPDAGDIQDAALQNVLALRERFDSGDTPTMRAVLKEVIDHISLNFQRVGSSHRFVSGTIHLRPF